MGHDVTSFDFGLDIAVKMPDHSGIDPHNARERLYPPEEVLGISNPSLVSVKT